MHPMMAERMDLWRLREFELERLPSADDIYLFRARARENPRDERLVALAEVRDLTALRDEDGRITALPRLERITREAYEAMRSFQASRSPRDRLHWNRLLLYAWPPIDFQPARGERDHRRFARMSVGLGLELSSCACACARTARSATACCACSTRPAAASPSSSAATHLALQPLDDGAQRIISARRRGLMHPAEIVKLLDGDFQEHDLGSDGDLVPVDRPVATNTASIVVGLIRNRTGATPRHAARGAAGRPDAQARLARRAGVRARDRRARPGGALDVPVRWFAVSSGAQIAMDSGTENMDWVAAALRRIVSFTQAGGEINIVVTGINVGAQPYWNAEATMLMHTKGILVMTPESAMVLTGKQALDYSGGVSAEDNFGIGGYERVMGPNGQAQYWAPDLAGACDTLLDYYERSYVAPGERFPRRAETRDAERDVRESPHSAPDSDLETVGAIFSEDTNPGRKKPFDVRSVMRAVADADHEPLERWAGLREGENAVAWDAFLGGWPVSMLGIESRLLPRFGRARRRPGVVERGHAVPASRPQDRARHQRRVGPAPARGARQPGGLRRLARVDAPAAARVRRGDRARGGQLRRADRVLRDLALPRRRVRGVLAATERQLPVARARARARVGDRRRARRGSRVRPRRQRAHAGGPADRRARQADRVGGGRRARAPAGRARGAGRTCARRSSASWPQSSTRSTAWSGRSRSARSTGSSPPPSCGLQ